MKRTLLAFVCAVSVVAVYAVEGALTGLFSVSAGKQVYFSRGNLQYQAQFDNWRFAENQYDYVGNSRAGNVDYAFDKSDNARIARTYDGWIDLFGWGTGKKRSRERTCVVSRC